MYVGIDVAAKLLHGVTIIDEGHQPMPWVATTVEEAVCQTRRSDAVAVDAPQSRSTAPHQEDNELGPKFRPARCAEIALGRDFGIWVPWVAPGEGEPVPSWMETGFRLFAALSEARHVALEVYPYAGFRRLSTETLWSGETTLPRKTTPAGAAIRVELLRRAGLGAVSLCGWTHRSHDAIDAAMAALVARRWAQGRAVAATCGHDGSSIWLP